MKSANVLVFELPSAALVAKIADFGSVKATLIKHLEEQEPGNVTEMTDRQNLTQGVGTPIYMAPEVLAGEHYHQSADIFSFGVIMWEVAMQKCPDLLENKPKYNRGGPFMGNLLRALEAGHRLEFTMPCDATPWYLDLAKACWRSDRYGRPTAREVLMIMERSSRMVKVDNNETLK